MADGKVVVESLVDDSGITRGLKAIKNKLASFDKNLIKTAALGSAVALSSSLIPMIAAATAATIALVASFASAGIGAVAFGAVAVGVLSEVFEAADQVAQLEEKIANADSIEERIAAQKELAAVYADMSDAQRYALEELKSFKEFWGDFVKQFETPVLDSFGLSLNIVKNILDGLAPTITNVSGVVVELLESLDQDIAGGGFKEFFGWLETNAAESLRNWASIAGNVFGGFFGLLQAFTPLGATMEEKLLSITERFKTWASTLESNPAFQNFIDYIQTNGPIVWETIKNIGSIIGDIVTAAAPIGTEVLNGFQALMDKVSEMTPHLEDISAKVLDFVSAVQDNWPAVRETVIGLSTAVASFALIMKGLQIIGMVNTLLAAYRAGTLTATLAQLGLNTAMLANPITWIVALIAGLIAIGVLLYRNWDTVKEKAVSLWSMIKEKFAAIKEAIQKPIGEAAEFVKEQIDKIVGFFKNMKIGLPDIKLPKFSLSGKFSLDPLSVPKIGVQWLAEGGIVPPNMPGLVGMGDNKLHKEIAMPLSPSVLGMVGKKIADTMGVGSGKGDIKIEVNALETNLDEDKLLRVFQRSMMLYE